MYVSNYLSLLICINLGGISKKPSIDLFVPSLDELRPCHQPSTLITVPHSLQHTHVSTIKDITTEATRQELQRESQETYETGLGPLVFIIESE